MSVSRVSPDQKILFAVHPTGGLGDLGVAVKVRNLFVDRNFVTNEQVQIRSTKSSKCFNCYSFDIEPLTGKRGHRRIVELIPVSNLALQVIASVSGYGEAYFHLRRKEVKTLALKEYGFDADPIIPALDSIYRSLPLGLSTGSIGIYIESDWEAQHQLKGREERMQRLDKVSPEAAKRIRGDLAQFALYMGYSDDTDLRLGFVHAVLQLNTIDDTVVFVLPCLEMSVQKDLLQIGKRNGVGKVIISNEEGEIIHDLNEKGRTVKYCVGDFDHSDLLFILQASEKETLVTGDQTVSEAISANKQFCYEARDYKQTFAGSMRRLFQSFRQETIHPNVRIREWDNFETYSDQMLKIFDPNMQEIFSQFNRYVCINRNCIPIVEMNALEMIESTVKQKVVYLFDIGHFDPTKLEDNTVYILSLDQILLMEIIEKSGRSQLPELSGKHYETGSLSGLHYLVAS